MLGRVAMPVTGYGADVTETSIEVSKMCVEGVNTSNLPRVVPMMPMPSSGDLTTSPFMICQPLTLQLKKAILRYLSPTKIHLMKKMDRCSCEKTVTDHQAH